MDWTSCITETLGKHLTRQLYLTVVLFVFSLHILILVGRQRILMGWGASCNNEKRYYLKGKRELTVSFFLTMVPFLLCLYYITVNTREEVTFAKTVATYVITKIFT